jgi:type I restriction enzyme S subunit
MSKIDELIKQYCPNGVEYKRINEFSNYLNGMTGVNNKWADDGNCQFIDYMNVYKHLVIDVNDLPCATVKTVDKQTTLQKGDVLFTSASETPDECALSAVIEDDIRDGVFMDDHLFGIRINDDFKDALLPSYLKYAFRSHSFRESVNKSVRGVTRHYVSKPDFMKLFVPVPPLSVQQEIVRILDEYTAVTDELKSELNAEVTARKLQYSYYRDKLLTFDDDVEMVKLKKVTEFYNGDRGKNYPSRSEMVEDGIPFINAGDIETGTVNINTCNKITREKYDSLGGAKIKVNDIIYCLRGSIGKNALVDNISEGTVASSLCVIRAKEQILPKFMYYILNSNIELKQRLISNNGAAQPNLSAKSVSNYQIPLPNLEKQKEIVEKLDVFSEITSDLEKGLPKEIELRTKQYEYYRDKLLNFKRKDDA